MNSSQQSQPSLLSTSITKPELFDMAPTQRHSTLQSLLTQSPPIHIIPGCINSYSFPGDNLTPHVRDATHLMNHNSPFLPAVIREAAAVFYAGNEFLVPAECLVEWVAYVWGGGEARWRPSAVVRRVGVLFGNACEGAGQGGGEGGQEEEEEGELRALRQMDELESVRVVFCDFGYHGLGLDGLRGCLGSLMALERTRPGISIRLQTHLIPGGIPKRQPGQVFDYFGSVLGAPEQEWRDITDVLTPLTEEQAELVRESRRMGVSANCITVTALVKRGWDVSAARWVVNEGFRREAVTRWVEDELARSRRLGMGDVEMEMG